MWKGSIPIFCWEGEHPNMCHISIYRILQLQAFGDGMKLDKDPIKYIIGFQVSRCFKLFLSVSPFCVGERIQCDSNLCQMNLKPPSSQSTTIYNHILEVTKVDTSCWMSFWNALRRLMGDQWVRIIIVGLLDDTTCHWLKWAKWALKPFFRHFPWHSIVETDPTTQAVFARNQGGRGRICPFCVGCVMIHPTNHVEVRMLSPYCRNMCKLPSASWLSRGILSQFFVGVQQIKALEVVCCFHSGIFWDASPRMPVANASEPY